VDDKMGVRLNKKLDQVNTLQVKGEGKVRKMICRSLKEKETPYFISSNCDD